MTINLKAPENLILKPVITVFGVGGAGGNAVNNMINSKLQGATFVVANTDAQALEFSASENKIQLGVHTTRGLGAGASPEIGAAAAEESFEEIRNFLEGSNMVFITAGMGGGTGTGAAPVVAKFAKEMGILTVGVVTKPFHFEGMHRMRTADKGLAELQKYVDTLIVIPNQNLFRIANERTTFADAFKMADDVLHNGVRSVTDLMIMPGLINLDYADIKAVMSEMGKAMMGTGEASGENRAIEAAERAIANPLLEHHSMRGARGVLINITGGPDMTLMEVDAAANRIREEIGDDEANIIFGSTFNQSLEGVIRVSVVATGIDADAVASIRSSFSQVHNNESHGHIDPQIEPIISNDELHEEEVEVALEEEFVDAEGEEDGVSAPPRFNEYHMAEAQVHNKNASSESGPIALLKKMWGGLSSKPVEKEHRQHDAYNTGYKSDSRTSSHENSDNEVYEIPAFLRRRK
jgi:cell division protein FtsZ